MPTLVLIRHGQSQWNVEQRFTGWAEPALSAQGVAEGHAAGRLLAARGFDFDLCFTSLHDRAIHTLGFVLEEMDRLWLPVEKSWRLNAPKPSAGYSCPGGLSCFFSGGFSSTAKPSVRSSAWAWRCR